MKKYFAFVALGTLSAALATPASAVVVGGFTLENGNFGGQYGVHGAGGNQSSGTVFGEVNQEGSSVAFSTTTGVLNLNGGGEASIDGDPVIENLTVVFGVAWDRVTFAFQGESDFSLLVNGSALFSGGACGICISTGANTHFTLTGPDITTLAFNFDPGIGSARQFRVEAVSQAVPEPATWAMMIGGLGLAGGLMRRRSSKVQFA